MPRVLSICLAACPASRMSASDPLTPQVATARRLAGQKRRSAVLYTCNTSLCGQLAQVVKANLAAINIDVAGQSFPEDVYFARLARQGEPFDLAFGGWVADYPDPDDFLNFLIGSGGAGTLPPFEDPGYQRKVRTAATLDGPVAPSRTASSTRTSLETTPAVGRVRQLRLTRLPLGADGMPGLPARLRDGSGSALHPPLSIANECRTRPPSARLPPLDERRSDTFGLDWPAPLTVRDVAAELRCSEDEVRALIRNGELQTVACWIRPGLVPRHQLDDYLRRLQHRLERLGPILNSAVAFARVRRWPLRLVLQQSTLGSERRRALSRVQGERSGQRSATAPGGRGISSASRDSCRCNPRATTRRDTNHHEPSRAPGQTAIRPRLGTKGRYGCDPQDRHRHQSPWSRTRTSAEPAREAGSRPS